VKNEDTTRDELRDKIVALIWDIIPYGTHIQRGVLYPVADQIIALFEGWKSPQEVKEAVFQGILFSDDRTVSEIQQGLKLLEMWKAGDIKVPEGWDYRRKE
jgi:hypothetical protein